MTKICVQCKQRFPGWLRIDGKMRNLNSRKYCLTCSPRGRHNTKNLEIKRRKTKICATCKRRKYTYLFYHRGDRTLHKFLSSCKNCMVIYQRNEDTKNKKKLIELMGGGCKYCGYNKHWAPFQLHHRKPKTKEYSWTDLRSKGWVIIRKEIKKCDLVCANCHIILHTSEGL